MVESHKPFTTICMNQPWLVIQRNLWLGILMAVLLLTMHGTAWGSDSSVQTAPPSVLQPKDTQHGFSQYDTPPDYFSDVPSLYDSYSQSPLVPSLDKKPEGVFLDLTFAESFEVKPTTRGGHTHIPVRPTETFLPSITSVYLVFTVHEHLSSYQIIGRLFSDSETDMNDPQWLDEDIVDLATEDESGFLKFFPPDGTWQPGPYRVEIFVGYIANDVNKLGTMRFTITSQPVAPALP